jgi:hypothetical protein
MRSAAVLEGVSPRRRSKDGPPIDRSRNRRGLIVTRRRRSGEGRSRQGESVARFRQAQKEFILAADLADFVSQVKNIVQAEKEPEHLKRRRRRKDERPEQ